MDRSHNGVTPWRVVPQYPGLSQGRLKKKPDQRAGQYGGIFGVVGKRGLPEKRHYTLAIEVILTVILALGMGLQFCRGGLHICDIVAVNPHAHPDRSVHGSQPIHSF